MDLILTLAGTIALPFIVVASTSPLVQHWLRNHPSQRPVYTLYAVSNIGSFAGLLAYPFLIEPLFSVDRQFRLWVIFFVIVAMGIAWLAMASRAFSSDSSKSTESDHLEIQPGWRDRLLWLALPAGTSALLLASTNELCQDLAVFPFLWVVPLSLYLLSFVLTFRARPIGNQLAPAAVVTLVGMGAVSISIILPVLVLIILVNALVFMLCVAAHRELYRVRPSTQHLTSFYLWSAAGSVLGAMAVNLLSPFLFLGYWEFPISVLAIWVVLAAAAALDPGGSLRTGDSRQAAALLGVVIYLLINFIPEEVLQQNIPRWTGVWSVPLRIAVTVATTMTLWMLLRKRRFVHSPIWPRVLAGLVLFLVECWLIQRIRNDNADAVHVSRNFFGVVRLQEMVNARTGLHMRQLTHGRINHGVQYMNAELIDEPTTYHSNASGIGRLLRALQARRESINIGVTGLGAGSLAAYPRPGDRMVFYEIDPQVVSSASGDDAFFTFLGNCQGEVEVVTGDARQSMQRELKTGGSRNFDVLALDAFSSDAIPTHLLTREAIALCLEHLADPGGMLAINISNRFLDIEPVVADSARFFGLNAVVLDAIGDPPVRVRSIWVLLSRQPDIFKTYRIAVAARPLTSYQVAWTDAYSSPFTLLKWWSTAARRVPIFSPEKSGSVNPLEPSPEQTTHFPEG